MNGAKDTTSSRTDRARPVLVALGAGAMYGSWAAYANRFAGVGAALRSAAMQAALSVGATLLFVTLLERLFRWPESPVRGVWLAACGTSVFAAAVLFVGHALAGTPHIAATIAPSVTIGTTFYVTYARALFVRSRR